MFRVKVAATLFLAFAVAGGLIYFQAAEQAETQAQEAAADKLSQAQSALEQARQLQDFALIAKAEEVARWPQIGQILSRRPQDYADPDGALPPQDQYRFEIHKQMNTEVYVWAEKFKALEKGDILPRATLADHRREKPDLFMVLNNRGVGVARADDPAWYGPEFANEGSRYPVLSKVPDGRSFKDIWQWKGASMNVAVAPVRFGGQVVGSVVLGYRLTGAEARADKQLVDAGGDVEVAYFVGELLKRSSSVDADAETILRDLKLHESEAGGGVTFEMGGQTWKGRVGKLKGNASAEGAGFLVFTNLDVAVASATSFLPFIPLMAALAFFMSVALFLVFHRQFLKPLEGIDAGVLEIINGNLDYWFEVNGDSKELPDTMGQNLNIMVCHLSGRPLPENEDEPPKPVKRMQWTPGADQEGEQRSVAPLTSERSPAPMAAQFTSADTPVPVSERSGLSPEILALVNEDEETYLRRVYREYVDASRRAGASLQNITFERFTDQLNNHADDLKGRYNCSRIRFIINIREQRVSLKPVPIA